jgi:hypothetical protein
MKSERKLVYVSHLNIFYFYFRLSHSLWRLRFASRYINFDHKFCVHIYQSKARKESYLKSSSSSSLKIVIMINHSEVCERTTTSYRFEVENFFLQEKSILKKNVKFVKCLWLVIIAFFLNMLWMLLSFLGNWNVQRWMKVRIIIKNLE